MAEYLLSFPWILSSHLQRSTWNFVPVAGTKEQVSVWGTPAPYSPSEQDLFHPVVSAPRPVTQLMQEDWAVQHKTLNCQEVAPPVHPVVPRWDQAVAGGAKASYRNNGTQGLSRVCVSAPLPALPSLASRQAQLAAECRSGRLHTWHIPEQLQTPFPSICKSFCAIPGCCCIALGGLLRVFPQVFGEEAYSKKHLHLIFTASVLFLSDAKK